jgi:hypothetical protein
MIQVTYPGPLYIAFETDSATEAVKQFKDAFECHIRSDYRIDAETLKPKGSLTRRLRQVLAVMERALVGEVDPSTYNDGSQTFDAGFFGGRFGAERYVDTWPTINAMSKRGLIVCAGRGEGYYADPYFKLTPKGRKLAKAAYAALREQARRMRAELRAEKAAVIAFREVTITERQKLAELISELADQVAVTGAGWPIDSAINDLKKAAAQLDGNDDEDLVRSLARS